jgi:hypothetical protein
LRGQINSWYQETTTTTIVIVLSTIQIIAST